MVMNLGTLRSGNREIAYVHSWWDYLVGVVVGVVAITVFVTQCFIAGTSLNLVFLNLLI